jgi:predicted glycoside hydrolase/deacetylase ChbG (UPF0249 family)
MKNQQKPKVAIVIPVYNPPDGWWQNTLEHILLLVAMVPEYDLHFVVVNDGSAAHIFKEFDRAMRRAGFSYTRYSHTQNYGKGRALKTGVSHTKADYFICVDWDFPFGARTIQQIIDKLRKGAQVVILDRGMEYIRALPVRRAFITSVWRQFINRYLHLGVPDTQGGTKGFDAGAAKYFVKCRLDGFMHDTEFVYRARVNGLILIPLPARLRPGIQLTRFPTRTYVREYRFLNQLLTMMKEERHKRIIVNADDFGMNEDVNRGIKRGIQSGIITSVSVMVNMPQFDDAVRFLKRHRKVEVGLHFNITEGKPDPNGLFRGLIGTAVQIIMNKNSLKAAREQLRVQYDKLKKTGLPITHIDSHEHIHVLVPLFKDFLDFANAHKIPKVRHSKIRAFDIFHSFSLEKNIKQLIILVMYGIDYLIYNSYFSQKGQMMYLNDMNWLRNPTEENWLRSLNNLPYGQTEVICHVTKIPFNLDYNIVTALKKNKIWYYHS